MFGKSNKPSPIDTLIGAGTTIEGDITFTGGLRIDGNIKGNVKALGSKPGTLVVSELAKVEEKLANEAFVSKAPDHIVDGMRARQVAGQEALATLRAQRDQLA